MVAVGDEQLELQRLEIGGRVGAGEKPSSDDEQRVDLAEGAELRRPGPGTSCTRSAAGVTSSPSTTSASALEPLVGDRRHAEVRSSRTRRRPLRQRREQGRLPDAGQADDADFERHSRRLAGAEADAALAREALHETIARSATV